ncbi:MAG: MBL fold metallo-hydrolase [Candidatus Pacebacteria bacterium]|nr:MBL fold metallo-hydrolase [Candidatus Paceibacterota bacterium]MDD3728705.1 MBL fold metallo-hydrolase [Candidatus Paceibacterota bacterium]MDD4201437.1 MBL fold metallo-hydrolase [Candidatus Paceibacterota bacterium]MDD4466953.1 MBL fold metallo-hydrolase [Candidatus Paceibacterota bacterium]MDD5445731.1 MBL fold metallo-hydrolase [Candidatus Paceibacterota bacterium]
MNIFWHTKTCVEINAVPKKDGAVNIIIDPLNKEEASRGKKMKADVFLFTKKEKRKQENEGFIIDGPGEYEIKEIFIKGIEISPSLTIYLITAEDITLCHLGLINQDELSNSQVEELGDIDVLFLPVEGEECIDAKKAAKIMGQLEPRITVPVNYKEQGIKSKTSGLKSFLDNLGIKSPESSSKLSLKKKTILEENSKVVILTS